MHELIQRSFERCREKGLRSNHVMPEHISKEMLKEILEENKLFIKIFKKEIDNIKTKIKYELVFVITDVNGIMLDYDATNYFRQNGTLVELREGLDFSEKSCGTNAISLAMELKKCIEIKKDQHFYDAFKKWHCFAMPLYANDRLIGYLNVSTINKILKSEFIVILELLSTQISRGLCDELKKKTKMDNLLSSTQINILKYISKGYIENKIAFEMNLSQDTIKYHKRKIFSKLEVNSSCEAIMKSIRLGMIEY
ncbi:LuxR family transcriptional regulator [Clostridium sp. ZS2-4]|uniref:LuxR family transcriptional regulator n=1 Tax=Clostridium sp. ZS2-4 TaxID=2987703 RepID=UPI00227B9AA4|nr:LuxR C-terminal-related transcriptional regulator [Clostridium sp. ZS2-4]MCY6355928.1 LuxR C-terminal-related transcriptional regulator [Clostridium sp. ZS2-4]